MIEGIKPIIFIDMFMAFMCLIFSAPTHGASLIVLLGVLLFLLAIIFVTKYFAKKLFFREIIIHCNSLNLPIYKDFHNNIFKCICTLDNGWKTTYWISSKYLIESEVGEYKIDSFEALAGKHLGYIGPDTIKHLMRDSYETIYDVKFKEIFNLIFNQDKLLHKRYDNYKKNLRNVKLTDIKDEYNNIIKKYY